VVGLVLNLGRVPVHSTTRRVNLRAVLVPYGELRVRTVTLTYT
jgi:hypothetical protein